MSDGWFWQAKKARSQSEGLEHDVSNMRRSLLAHMEVLEGLADPCDGCREGMIQCSHAVAVRISLGVPEAEASKIKNYAEWKAKNRKPRVPQLRGHLREQVVTREICRLPGCNRPSGRSTGRSGSTRYSQNLTDFLTCMRDGHDSEPWGLALACKRCCLIYRKESGATTEPVRRCACGHSQANHGPLTNVESGRCLLSCGCLAFQTLLDRDPGSYYNVDEDRRGG
jgi:hypothetical protein